MLVCACVVSRGVRLNIAARKKGNKTTAVVAFLDLYINF